MTSLSREITEITIQRAGEFFMYSIWLQGQMSDLIILNQSKHIIPDFIANPSQVPNQMSTKRAKYWEMSFLSVKNEFVETFTLSDQHKNDLNAIYHLRNAIAHSHVSMGRSYLLFFIVPHGVKDKKRKLYQHLVYRPSKDNQIL